MLVNASQFYQLPCIMLEAVGNLDSFNAIKIFVYLYIDPSPDASQLGLLKRASRSNVVGNLFLLVVDSF